MSTIIGLEELISHINDVYPRRGVNQQEQFSDNQQFTEKNMTTTENNHVIPLDLVDIRKEQRRLAALFQIKSRDPLFSVPKPRYRPAPKQRCVICNLPSAERRLFSGNRWESVPRIPNPSFYEDQSVAMVSDTSSFQECEHDHGGYSDDESMLLRSWNQSEHQMFRFPTSDYQTNGDMNANRFLKNRFKLPPVFSSTDTSLRDEGRLIALASDKTFLGTRVGERVYTDDFDTSSGTPRSTRLSKIEETSDSGKTDIKRRDSLRRTTHSENPKLPTENHKRYRTKQRDRRTNSPSESFDQSRYIGDSATFRYHHRQPSDILPVPLNSPDRQYLLDEQQQEYLKMATITSPMRSTRELSFEFVRDDASSGYSRETTVCDSPTGFTFRVKSGSWCHCSSDVDLFRLRCSECLKIGGHHRWCISKIDLCPECGKAVQNSMEVFGERHISRSPSITLKKENTSSSVKVQDFYKFKSQNSELKVRFSDTDAVRSISPTETMMMGDEIVDNQTETMTMRDEIVDNQPMKNDLSDVTEHTSISKDSKPLFRKPLVDSDFHKAAYEMALSDSRVMKYKKLKNLDTIFSNSLTGTLFSYFPKLRRTPSKDVSASTIGLRDPNETQGVKVKKGMKHIFGKVKMEDYYPKGKKSRL